MTLGEIIKAYRDEHELSMDSFAEKSGISKAYISLLEKNKHPKTGKPITPSIITIKQAADGMNMDFNILFNMIDGDVRISNAPTDDGAFDGYSNIHPISKSSLPVLGSIACGNPIYMDEQIEFYVDTVQDLHADFVLIAKGDSMTGARIYDGDLVFVRKQNTVENGDLAVIAIDDEATLKRYFFYKDRNLLILKPENPQFEDLIYSGDELEQIRILGKAVSFQSNIK